MPVTHCYLCEKNPADAARYGDSGYQEGVTCPVCQRAACKHHLAVVRWRWRTPTRDLDSAQICRECKKGYKHRSWDPHHREWIT
jgi:hypothetical protein